VQTSTSGALSDLEARLNDEHDRGMKELTERLDDSEQKINELKVRSA
jgi:hypothetical protein